MRWSGEHVSARALEVKALMRSAVEERMLLTVVTDWNEVGLGELRLVFPYRYPSLHFLSRARFRVGGIGHSSTICREAIYSILRIIPC